MIQISLFSALKVPSKNKNHLFLFFALLFSIGFSNNIFSQSYGEEVTIVIPEDSTVIRIDKRINQWIIAGDTLAILKNSKGNKIKLISGISGRLMFWKMELAKKYTSGETVGIIKTATVFSEEISNGESIN